MVIRTVILSELLIPSQGNLISTLISCGDCVSVRNGILPQDDSISTMFGHIYSFSYLVVFDCPYHLTLSALLKLHSFLSKMTICRSPPPPITLGKKPNATTRMTLTSNQQDCIPVGCIPPACWLYLPACTVQGGCLLRGVPALGGACSRHALRQTPRILDTRYWKHYPVLNFVCGW